MSIQPKMKSARERLLTPHFGGQDIETPDVGEPVADTIMRLNLDQLIEYDRNPRIAPNSEYDALKESLRSTGADRVLLVVTRRPGEEKYFPSSGGNTRLRILRELWEERQEDRFYWVQCKVVPWTHDTKVMVGHLSENDHRADYIFIDRARAICDLYLTLEEEKTGRGEKLTQRGFIEELKALGYPSLSRTQLGRFQSAVSLYPYMPQVLNAGMGPWDFDQILSLRNSLKGFLVKATRNPDIGERVDTVFPSVLSDLDKAEGIDHNAAATAVFALLAAVAGDPVPESDTDEILEILEKLWTHYKQDTDSNVFLYDQIRTRSKQNRSGEEIPSYDTADESPDNGSGAQNDAMGTVRDEGDSGERKDEQTHESRYPSDPDETDSGRESPHLDQGHLLRYHGLLDDAVEHATDLARVFHLEDLVHKLTIRGGYGFWIDLPTPRPDRKTATAWWYLFELSGLSDDPRGILSLLKSGEIPPSSRLIQQFLEVTDGHASLSSAEIDALPKEERPSAVHGAFLQLLEAGIPRPAGLTEFLLALPDSAYSSLFSLMNVRRSLAAILPRNQAVIENAT